MPSEVAAPTDFAILFVMSFVGVFATLTLGDPLAGMMIGLVWAFLFVVAFGWVYAWAAQVEGDTDA